MTQPNHHSQRVTGDRSSVRCSAGAAADFNGDERTKRHVIAAKSVPWAPLSEEVMRFQNETDANVTGRVLYAHEAIDDLCISDSLAAQIEFRGNSQSPTNSRPSFGISGLASA